MCRCTRERCRHTSRLCSSRKEHCSSPQMLHGALQQRRCHMRLPRRRRPALLPMRARRLAGQWPTSARILALSLINVWRAVLARRAALILRATLARHRLRQAHIMRVQLLGRPHTAARLQAARCQGVTATAIAMSNCTHPQDLRLVAGPVATLAAPQTLRDV